MKKIILLVISILPFVSYAQERYGDVPLTENPDYQKGMEIIESLFDTIGNPALKDNICRDISYYWTIYEGHDKIEYWDFGLDNFLKSYYKHIHFGLAIKMNDSNFSFTPPFVLENEKYDHSVGGWILKESTFMRFQWEWLEIDDGYFSHNYIVFELELDEKNKWKLSRVDNFPLNY